MIRTVKLENYLPLYIQEYREMWKLMQAENPEFQLANNETEKIKNNLFIETCDEKGISRFESIMGIFPPDTLESRISRVLTRWNEKLPYTYFYLLSKLNSLCGVNNYEIVKRFNKYEMDITTHLELSGQVEELDYLLNSVIPAFSLSDNFKEDFIANTEDCFAGAVINTIKINITDNFNDNININIIGNSNIGSILSVCENLVIGKE